MKDEMDHSKSLKSPESIRNAHLTEKDQIKQCCLGPCIISQSPLGRNALIPLQCKDQKGEVLQVGLFRSRMWSILNRFESAELSFNGKELRFERVKREGVWKLGENVIASVRVTRGYRWAFWGRTESDFGSMQISVQMPIIGPSLRPRDCTCEVNLNTGKRFLVYLQRRKGGSQTIFDDLGLQFIDSAPELVAIGLLAEILRGRSLYPIP